MKTVFLSLPMKNRTDEDIKQTIKQMARVILAMYPGEGIQFVDNFSSSHSFTNEEENEAKNKSLLYLGDAIQKMAHCDYFAYIISDVFWKGEETYHGCFVEEQVASRYNLHKIILNDPTGEIYLPDLKEKVEKWCKENMEPSECCNSCK